MSLFNKEKDNSNKGTEEVRNYKLKTENSNKLILLFDFEQARQIKYDEELTKLIKGRLLEISNAKTVAPDSASYICFEIPEDMTLREISEKGIFEALYKIGKMSNLKPEEYNHLGRILKQENEKFGVKNATQAVELYIQTELNPEILKKKEALKNRISQSNKKSNDDFKSKMAEEYEKYNEKVTRQREERKKNIFLEEQFRYKIGDKVYSDYKGTDTAEGKILRINKLSNMKENEEDEYVCSAFIQKVEKDEEQKTILEGMPAGNPVIFTLDKDIQELVENSNEQEIKKVLDLLSKVPKEEFQKEELTFIGGIDKQGKIYRDYKICSDKIKQKIEDEQNNFKESMQKQNLEVLER